MDDLDVLQGAGGAGAVDPLFAGAEDVGEGERRAGFEPVAAFSDAVLTVVSTDARRSRDKGTPSVVLGFEVLEHALPDQEGRKTGPIDFYLVVNRKDGEEEAEYQKRKRTFLEGVNRMKAALELSGYPASLEDVNALKAWIAPALGKSVIADLQIDRSGDAPRNRIWMSSFDHPSAPQYKKGKDGKKVALGKTALEQAREKIRAARERAAKGGGARGATAGARTPSGPGSFD